jgi:chromosome segregation ATPase
MGDFRRNVEPEVRRKTNKSLLELKEFQTEYNSNREAADKAERKLHAENEKLAIATQALEEARNQLSDAQEEIDADYLPEGAQPRARIQKRDTLALVCTLLHVWPLSNR